MGRRVTRHAAQRGVDRLGLRGEGRAARALEASLDASVRLPHRYGATLSKGKPSRQKGHSDFRVAGTIVLVVNRGRVITTWRLSDDQLATVLLYVASGYWIDGQEG